MPSESAAFLQVSEDDVNADKPVTRADDGVRLQQAMEDAQHEGCATTIILVSLAVVLGVVSLSAMLLIYVFVVHQAYIDSTSKAAIISTAKLQYIITISGLLSSVISRTVPVVVTVYAYHVAAAWLRTSQLSRGQDRPSPMQSVRSRINTSR